MEIKNLFPPSLFSARSTSSVEDGDVGQNGNLYSQARKKSHKHPKQDAEKITLQIADSHSQIDILV